MITTHQCGGEFSPEPVRALFRPTVDAEMLTPAEIFQQRSGPRCYRYMISAGPGFQEIISNNNIDADLYNIKAIKFCNCDLTITYGLRLHFGPLIFLFSPINLEELV